MKKLLSFVLVVVMVFSITATASATTINGVSNSNFTVVESGNIRTVTDHGTGATVSYDIERNILMVKETPTSKVKTFDLSVYEEAVTKSGSAYSKNNEYGYSSKGNPTLWTLQIPNQIKFTYERTQGALISSFVSNVDRLIDQENEMWLLYGGGVVAVLLVIASGGLAAAIIALLGVGVDVGAVVNGINAIKTYKSNATYYFGRIVTYSTP